MYIVMVESRDWARRYSVIFTLDNVFPSMNSYTPTATRYAELGGSWNSEVNKGNHARQGQYKLRFIFMRQKLLRVKICTYQIYMTKKACMAEIKVR